MSADDLPPNSAGYIDLLDLELLNGVDRGTDDQVVEIFVGHLDAVEQVDVVAAPLTVDCREAAGLFERCSAGASGRNRDTVGQLRKMQELPAVQRQLNDLAVADDLADIGALCLKQRRRSGNRERLRELPDLQHDGDIDSLTDRKDKIFLHVSFEACQLHDDHVRPDGQIRKKEAASRISDPRRFPPARCVRRHNGRAGQYAALRVTHDA